jgi:hypothetical protein
MLTFVELPVFAKYREAYLDDDEFAALQAYLLTRPDAGDVIPGSGGCRKLRWRGSGRGKRGGLRVVYFCQRANGQIVLVTLYAKNVTDNIAAGTLKALKEAFDG